MAYNLLATEQTVHVLATSDVVDAVRATVQTPSHGVVAASIVPLTVWGQTAGIDQLNQVAFDVDYIIDHTAAVSGIGNQSIDSNGLSTGGHVHRRLHAAREHDAAAHVYCGRAHALAGGD